MSPRTFCLLFAVVLGAAANKPQDTTGSVTFIQACEREAANLPLHLRCTFDRSKSKIGEITQMAIARSEKGGDEIQEFVALAVPIVAMSRIDGVIVSAEFHDEALSFLDVVWEADGEGYDRKYMCAVVGTDPDTKQYEWSYYGYITIGDPEDTSLCTYENAESQSNENFDEICVSSEAVRNNTALLEDVTGIVDGLCALKSDVASYHDEVLTLSEKVDDLSSNQVDTLLRNQNVLTQALTTVLSINTVKYDMSSMYNKHIYIVSKDEPTFDLESMNNLCENSNGYLVEFDDEEEQKFVTDFLATIGKYDYGMGGNDEEKEGTFVYYNSKKPMPNNLWEKYEPNDRRGNEDCVQIRPLGLNDIKCGRQARYVCEIPLF